MKPFLDSKLFLTLAGSLTNASEDWVVEEHSGSRNESDRNSTARNTRTPATVVGQEGPGGRNCAFVLVILSGTRPHGIA